MLTNPRRRIRSDSTLLSFCSRLDSKATSIRHHSIAILSFPWDSGIREGADPDLVKVTHQLQPTPRGQRLVRLLFENLIDRSAGTESTVVQREHCAHPRGVILRGWRGWPVLLCVRGALCGDELMRCRIETSGLLYPSCTYPVFILHRPLQLAENT